MVEPKLLSDKSPLEEFVERFAQVQKDLDKALDKALLSNGATTAASGYEAASGYVEVPGNDAERRLTDGETDKASRDLKKIEKRSKFRLIKDISKVRIGDRVRNRHGFKMELTGILQSYLDPNDGTLYLDFEGNEGNLWEEQLSDMSWDGNRLSVLLKKLFR